MSPPPTAPSLTRRAALTGLGAGVLGLMLARSHVALAQEATPAVPLATHPIVGAWYLTGYPATADDYPTIGVFAETGLYAELLWDRNVSLGEWRPIDASTVELLSFTKWLIPLDPYVVPTGANVAVPDIILTSENGTARVPITIKLDDTGTMFYATGEVWLYDEAGVNNSQFGYSIKGEKMTVATSAATPTA